MGGEHVVNKAVVNANGWRSVPLREAGTWLSGGTPSTSNPAYWDGDIPWISGASLKSFQITDSERRLTPLGAKSGSRLVTEGTTLLVVRGMSLMSEFRIGVTTRDMAFGQDIKALVPADGIDPYFLTYTIRAHTDQILRMVESTSHGTGRLDTDRLQELEIGVPPLDEQRRIVAVNTAFERQIGVLEATREKLHRVERAALNDLLVRCATMGEMLFADLLADIEAGWSPTCDSSPPAADEWGVIKVSAVTSGNFEARESKRLPASLAPKPRIEIRQGDVLVARANGARSLVGAACQVGLTRRRLMLSDKVLRLIPDSRMADGAFLPVLLRWDAVRNQIGNLLSGGTGQNNISQADIRSLKVPRIELRNQRKIVATQVAYQQRIAAVDKLIAKLRATQKAVIEDLFTSHSRPYAT